jgi:hypothetical protein
LFLFDGFVKNTNFSFVISTAWHLPLVRASLLERAAWEALADSLHGPVLHIVIPQNREGYMQVP